MGSGRLLCEVGGSRFISKTNLGLDKVASERGPLQTQILVDQHLILRGKCSIDGFHSIFSLGNWRALHHHAAC